MLSVFLALLDVRQLLGWTLLFEPLCKLSNRELHIIIFYYSTNFLSEHVIENNVQK